MKTISDAQKWASEVLKKNGIPNSRMEAASLLRLALDKDSAFLIAHNEYKLNEQEEKLYTNFVERRAKHEPFQHISGRQEFYGLEFDVSPDVMIPRPETETLAKEAIKLLENKTNSRFCDIGVGSGCIAISILSNARNSFAVCGDISQKALEVAKKNAEKHGVSDRAEFLISDVFENFEYETFALIVSNPPYVPQKDISGLQIEVRDHDPIIALTDGFDGLTIIERIAEEAPKWLTSGGYLFMEIGFNQSNAVREFFPESVWASLEFLSDLQGIPRIIKARKH